MLELTLLTFVLPLALLCVAVYAITATIRRAWHGPRPAPPEPEPAIEPREPPPSAASLLWTLVLWLLAALGFVVLVALRP